MCNKLGVWVIVCVGLAAPCVRADSVSLYDGGLLLSNGMFFNGSSTLDLSDHDLIISATAANRTVVFNWVTRLVKKALRDGGGIVGGDSFLKGLAVALNDDGRANRLFDVFDGHTVDLNTILVKHTWKGDTNLDGIINADDYFMMDSGFLSQQGGYRWGDLNYDGVVNADDYFSIDSAFAGQTRKLLDDAPILGATEGPGSLVPLPAAGLAGASFLVLLGCSRASGRHVRRLGQ